MLSVTKWMIFKLNELTKVNWKKAYESKKTFLKSVDDLWIHGQLTPNMRDVHINVNKFSVL